METRAAAPRDGGRLVATDVAQANVRVEGEGPAVVLIHGFSAALGWWDEIAPALAKTHRVIRLDLIGHGGTAAPRSGYEIPHQAALVAAVLDRLGVDRASVIGHSMGGEVATALLEARPAKHRPHRPDRHAANRGSGLRPPHACLPVSGAGASPVTSAHGLGASSRPRARVRAGLRGAAALRRRRAPADLHGVPLGPRGERRLPGPALRVRAPRQVNPVPPLLVIFGALDAIVSPQSAALYERVPGAEVIVLPGVGHSPDGRGPVDDVRPDRKQAHIRGEEAIRGTFRPPYAPLTPILSPSGAEG